MKGMVDHPSVPFVNGRTVDILEFQHQSVRWALEREIRPRCLQSILLVKLPSVAKRGEAIYFSHILERLFVTTRTPFVVVSFHKGESPPDCDLIGTDTSRPYT